MMISFQKYLKFITTSIYNLVAFLCLHPSVYSQNPVSEILTQWQQDSALIGANWSFKAIYTDDNRTIAEYQPKSLLVPASVMKLVSTAASLNILGPDYRFATEFRISGLLQKKNTLKGNITIKGVGDPSLFSGYFKECNPAITISAILDSLRKNEIEIIEGDVVTSSAMFDGYEVSGDWNIGDLGYYYGARPSPFTCFDNWQVITLSSDKSGNVSIVRLEQPADPTRWVIDITSNEKITENNVEIEIVNCFDQRKISGTLKPGTTNYQIRTNIWNPEIALVNYIKKALSDSGIIFKPWGEKHEKNPAVDSVSISLFVFSPALYRIDSLINTTSQNLYAEHIFITTENLLKKSYDTGIQIQSIKDYWTNLGMPAKGIFMEDGSGMSRSNALSAEALVWLLKYMTQTLNFQSFYAGLPVLGQSGTLKEIGKKTTAAGILRAKTGTMNRVRCFAGYTFSKSGRMIAFAFMTNQFTGSVGDLNKKAEALFAALVQCE
jgi:D-alanyl-D-alanine carboxypeptidase/D-alanyl-D-alanine-endopeptidase (penicillin-binding protein 4)